MAKGAFDRDYSTCFEREIGGITVRRNPCPGGTYLAPWRIKRRHSIFLARLSLFKIRDMSSFIIKERHALICHVSDYTSKGRHTLLGASHFSNEGGRASLAI
jgi:hypothetical protein